MGAGEAGAGGNQIKLYTFLSRNREVHIQEILDHPDGFVLQNKENENSIMTPTNTKLFSMAS